MAIVHADSLFTTASPTGPQLTRDAVLRVQPGTTPNYNRGSSLLKLLHLVEQTQLAAEREHYLQDYLEYLFPFRDLELYGPQGGDADNLDPVFQDNKTDFQKQNVAAFRTADSTLVRGWATAGTGRVHSSACRIVAVPIPRCPRRPDTGWAIASRRGCGLARRRCRSCSRFRTTR